MSFKKFFRKALPVVLIALPFVAPALVTTIGTAITPAGASAATITAAGQAAIAGTAQLAMGESPEQALKAAAGTFVGSQVTSNLPASIPKPVATGIGQTSGALVAGAKPSEALKSGVIGGIVSGVLPAPEKDAGLGDVATYALGRTALTKGLGSLFQPKTYSTASGGAGPTAAGQQPSTSVTTTGAGTAPGSSALAQALRTDMGAPIFGGDKDKEGRRSGWNVESLRYMGNSGEA